MRSKNTVGAIQDAGGGMSPGRGGMGGGEGPSSDRAALLQPTPTSTRFCPSPGVHGQVFNSPQTTCTSSPVCPVPQPAPKCRSWLLAVERNHHRSPASCWGEENSRQTAPPSLSPLSAGFVSSQPTFPSETRCHEVLLPDEVSLRLCSCLIPAQESPRSRRPAGTASAP